jgi:hypothetical protein
MKVLLRVKEQRNILHEIRKRKVDWIGHILRRNCLLQRVIEGKIQGGIEVTGRQGRRSRKLLDDLKERRGYSHLKEHLHVPIVFKSGSLNLLEPSGPVQAYNGIALPFYHIQMASQN